MVTSMRNWDGVIGLGCSWAAGIHPCMCSMVFKLLRPRLMTYGITSNVSSYNLDNSYHKACFRCSHGICVITPSNYVAHEHHLYCRLHHLQLFKQKGNFSELETHHYQHASY